MPGRVLILGAQGTLGRALAQVFSSDTKPILWDIDQIDITHHCTTQSRIYRLNPNLVINSAAYNDVEAAEKDSETAYAVNGYAVGNLATVCSKLHIPFVHYSSDYVFDGNKKAGYVESDVPNPISTYGQLKLLGEHEIRSCTDRFYIIRLSKLFGKSVSSSRSKTGFVELMLKLAAEKDIIDIVDEDSSSPTYSVDLARVTRYAVKVGMPFSTYHVTNSGQATWYQLAREVFDILKIDVQLNPVPTASFGRSAPHPKYSVLRNTKLPLLRPWPKALRNFLMKFPATDNPIS